MRPWTLSSGFPLAPEKAEHTVPRKPGRPSPLAGNWNLVIDILADMMAKNDKGPSAARAIDDLSRRQLLLVGSPRQKRSLERVVQRFLATIRECGLARDPASALQAANQRLNWGLDAAHLGVVRDLAARLNPGANAGTSMAECLRVARAAIFVGVRRPDPAAARDLIERYDFKSYATLVAELHGRCPAIRVDPVDVGATSRAFVHDLLARSYADVSLLFFVGSARSNCFADAAISLMFGLSNNKGRGRGARAERSALPFHFCWNSRATPDRRSSAMEVSAVDLHSRSIREAVIRDQAYAFQFNDRETLIAHRSELYEDYGVIVAQRRAGVTWIVAMGASGTATLACCQLIFSSDVLGRNVPAAGEGVLCLPVKCEVRRNKASEFYMADNRCIRRAQLWDCGTRTPG